MPSHLRNGRDLCTNNDNELSNISSALPELPGFSGLEASLPPLDDELLSLVPDRDVSAAGIHQVHASTATSGQGELPSNPPTDPDFGADRHSSSSYSAHSDPLNGSRKFDGYYTRASGPEFLGNNSQQSMGNVRPSPRLPGHLDDEIFSQRGRRNPRDDPEQSRPRGNDPTQSGLERPRGTSSFGRAIPASEHLDAESSSQQQQRRNAATTPSATTPAVGVLDESIYATPASFIAPSVPALSATGPDGPRLRTSTPLSPKRLRNQPVPTPSSRKLERIREEQEKTPNATQDLLRMGQFFMRAEAVMGRIRRARQIRTPRQPHQTQNPLQPPVKWFLTPHLRQLIRRVSEREYA
ncbi:hypothetical protein H4Q26_018041 [Puccinia striiformis f. sp. tritici PST-130]|nr:hypothetical protein H4Q26_018041 [Puccinia striiformis f. sp. tritici PST-130]